MDSPNVAVCCICAVMLSTLPHRDAPPCQLTDAEMMTSVSVAALVFGGTDARAHAHLVEHHYRAPAAGKPSPQRVCT